MSDEKASHHLDPDSEVSPWNTDEAGVVQIDPSLNQHEIGLALLAGVEPGDHIRRGLNRPPRWWWQRRGWYRRREVNALERIAIALEDFCNRAK